MDIKAGAARLGREYLTSASLKTRDVIYGERREVVYYGHVHIYVCPYAIYTNYIHNVYNVVIAGIVCRKGDGRMVFCGEEPALSFSWLFVNSVSALTFDLELAINILLSTLR